MTFVIGESVHRHQDNSCVAICPVDCIHPRADEPAFESASQLYIDPKACIDCGACVSECPVEAIFRETDLPSEWTEYAVINAEYYASGS